MVKLPKEKKEQLEWKGTEAQEAAYQNDSRTLLLYCYQTGWKKEQLQCTDQR